MATNTRLPQGPGATTEEGYIPFRLPDVNWGRYLRWLGYFAALVFIMWLGARIDGNPRGFLQATINGLLIGGVYALIAVGIVMIVKASGIFNFGHGAMMLVSSLAFYSFFTATPAQYSMFVVVGLAVLTVATFIAMNRWRDLLNIRALLIGAVVTVLLVLGMTLGGPEMRLIRALFGGITTAILVGLLIERFTIRPLVGQPLFTMILMTLALERVFAGVSLMLWGSIEKKLTIFGGLQSLGIPPVIRMDAGALVEGRITTINIDPKLMVGFMIALLIFGAFVAFFQYTNIGLAMRATSENQVLAQSVGLRVRGILAIAWAIATLLALAAGVLYGAINNIGTGMPAVAIQAFPAVLLGGLESIGGALVGGLVIGLAQALADLVFGNDAGTQLAPYVILMIVLIIRPDGLFGEKRIERI